MAMHYRKFLNVLKGSKGNRVQMVQWQRTNKKDQLFKLKKMKTGMYAIININSGKCVDVNGGAYKDGARVIQVIIIFNGIVVLPLPR